ncbi:MAG: ABC transporter permease, partial [Planctomycetota bacterium]
MSSLSSVSSSGDESDPVAAAWPRRHATPPASRDVTWPAVGAIAWREIVRFFRQRNRVIGAVMTPVVFWVLLGLGLNETFRVSPVAGNAGTGMAVAGGSDLGYLEFFFPGMVVLMVLFTAIFSTISVIEDRKEGFLQGVLASPAKRWAIVLGKVLGGAAIATAQGLVLLVIWCVFFSWPGFVNLIAAT